MNLNNLVVDDTLKRHLLEAYFRQQGGASGSGSVTGRSEAGSVVDPQEAGALVVRDAPDASAMDEFRSKVKTYIQLDNEMKKLRAAVRERAAAQKAVSACITTFMCKYSVEDINTRDGVLRCRISKVRPPVKRREIKQKLTEHFAHGDAAAGTEMFNKIYRDSERVERVSLRRLRIT